MMVKCVDGPSGLELEALSRSLPRSELRLFTYEVRHVDFAYGGSLDACQKRTKAAGLAVGVEDFRDAVARWLFDISGQPDAPAPVAPRRLTRLQQVALILLGKRG